MKKNISNKFFLIFMIAALISCKARKQALQAVKPVPVDSAVLKAANSKTEKINLIQSKQVNFDTFSGKARAHLAIDADSYDVTMNVRIKKNKEIWVSITAIAGIEVARAIITPDSIKVLNKLQGILLKKPFSYVYQYTGRQISYPMVEAIVIGNAVPEFITTEATISGDDQNLVFAGMINGLMYESTFGSSLKVTKLELSNAQAGQKLDVNNSDYIAAGSRILPSHISIKSVAGQQSIAADLHYIKADFNQTVDLPFNEPKSYTLIN